MTNYKIIQLTNNSVGTLSVGEYLPFGDITRKICMKSTNCDAYEVGNTGSNTITITEKGYYNIIYNASIIAASAGNITLSLMVNNEIVYTASATVVEGATANLTIPYIVRVFANCSSCPTNNPVEIKIALGGVGLTDGDSTLQIEKIY